MTTYTLTRPKVAPPPKAVKATPKRPAFTPKEAIIMPNGKWVGRVAKQSIEAWKTITLDVVSQPVYLYGLSGTLFLSRKMGGKRVTTHVPTQVVWPVTVREGIHLELSAVTSAQFILLQADELARLVLEFPDLQRDLMYGTVQSIEQMTQNVHRHSHANLSASIANLLLILANEDVVTFTHEQIATLLDTYRETITTLLSRFRRKGYISLRTNQISILDRNALVKEANKF